MRSALPFACASVVLLVAACGQPEEPAPFAYNQPPFILESTAVASGRHGAYVKLEAACPLWFEAWVQDPDVEDRVEYRWYVTVLETSGGGSEDPSRILADDGVLQNNDEPLRPPLRIDFKEGQPFNPMQNPGTYLVELMVFDGPLAASDGPGSVPDAEPIPGSDGEFNPRYSTSYAWTVEIVAGAQCSTGSP